MDPYNFDRSNVISWPQVRHPVSGEARVGQAGQEGFDQQLAEAGQAHAAIPEDRFLPDDLCNLYPRLSGQDRSLIETAICTAYVRGEADLRSGYACANTLARLANNLGSEGRSIAWLNDNQLRDYVKNSFPRGAYIVRALDYLREVRQQAGLQVAQASAVPRNHIQGQRDNQSAPLAFVQVAFDPEQIREAELRRVLDHLDGQSTPSAASLASGELERLEKELLDELHGGRDDHRATSFSVHPEEFTFNLEQFSPGEFRRLLDDQSIRPVPVDPEDSALNSGQSPPNALWRLLNDEPAPLGVASSSARQISRITSRVRCRLCQCTSRWASSTAPNGRRKTSCKECACTSCCRAPPSRRQIFLSRASTTRPP